MPDILKMETLKKIDKLSGKISVANNLDIEIRNELCTHMEDKLQGYLDGSEQITEDDAFILVREHFGDPANIRNLYQEVEEVATNVRLTRRIGAILTVLLLTGTVFSFLGFVVFHIKIIQPEILKLFQVFIPMLVAFFVLKKWHDDQKQGKAPWFITLKESHYIFVITAAILVRYMAFIIVYNYTESLTRFRSLYVEESIIFVLGSGFAWLWWCNTKNTVLPNAIAVIAWFAYYLSATVLWNMPLTIQKTGYGPYPLNMTMGYITSSLKPMMIVPILYLVFALLSKIRKKVPQLAGK